MNYYYYIFQKNSSLVYNCCFLSCRLNYTMSCYVTSMNLMVNSHNHNTLHHQNQTTILRIRL